MRLFLLLRSIALGCALGFAGWRGVEHLVHEGQPVRLLERAAEAAPAEPPSGLTAVLLFRPDECPQVMGVVDLLNDLAGQGLRIVGALTVEEYRMRDWRLLVEAQQIRFPVYRLDPGKARASIASLGYAGGPLLVVFDRDRRVLFTTDAIDQRDLRGVLTLLAERSVRANRRNRA